MLTEPHLPESILWWAAAHAERLQRQTPNVRDLICLHPKASRELLEIARPSAVANLHVNSPVAWTLPWTALFLPQRKTAHMALPRLFNEGELPLLTALSRHATFRGDSPAVAAIICSAGRNACSTVLASHPSLSPDVAALLRRHAQDSQALGQRSHLHASAQWSEVETAFLASCGPSSHLATFLVHASDRLPASLLLNAAQRGDWRLRLAAALNPAIMPRAREALATADACWAVRAAAMESGSDVVARTPLKHADLREEGLPPSAKARLKAARAYLRSRTADVSPQALRQIWEDREIGHFAVGGVLDDPATPVLCARSPMLSCPANARRSEIVRVVASFHTSDPAPSRDHGQSHE